MEDNWVIVYKNAFMNLTIEAPPVALKVFMSLMSKQGFRNGVRATKKAISDELKISYQSVIAAFKWLKENNYLKERKVDGQTEFLLNPDVTTCGRQKKRKLELWNSI